MRLNGITKTLNKPEFLLKNEKSRALNIEVIYPSIVKTFPGAGRWFWHHAPGRHPSLTVRGSEGRWSDMNCKRVESVHCDGWYLNDFTITVNRSCLQREHTVSGIDELFLRDGFDGEDAGFKRFKRIINDSKRFNVFKSTR